MSGKVQLIKEEIEKEMSLLDRTNEYDIGRLDELNHLVLFIDSLPEESTDKANYTTKDEDLEEEIDRFEDWLNNFNQSDYPTSYTVRDIARHFAEWQKQQMKETLQTEYEKGLYDMREEMMKDAVDAEVMYPASSSTLQIRYKLPKNTELKYGDRVKIIIIKTKQQ